MGKLMGEDRGIGSILLADCGTVMTKAVLLDRVAGQYRFVGQSEHPTTSEYPWLDVTVGIRQAVSRIGALTGRRFFDEAGDLIFPEQVGGDGVDALAPAVSASQPLEVVLAGLVRNLSVASLERAAAGTYSLVQAVLSNDGHATGIGDDEKMRVIRDCAPDVVCVAGGVEGGAVGPVLELAETVILACALIDENMRPHVLYAGNSQLRQRVVKIAAGRVELHVAANVRPAPNEENLLGAQTELDTLYLQGKMGTLHGFDTLSRWSPARPIPAARGFSRLVRYLWHLGDQSKGVLGIDLGATHSTIAAVFDGHPFLTVRGDAGMTFGGRQLLEQKDPEAVLRWLPEPMTFDEARGLLINKEIRPVSIPQEPRELWLEQALAREMIRATYGIARPGWQVDGKMPDSNSLPACETIVASGSALTHAPQPGQAALMILDGLQPTGITTLVLDAHGLAAALGALAAIKPLAMVEALDNGSLLNLATTVSPVGHARAGDSILQASVEYDDGSAFSIDVHYGELEVLPLKLGQQAVLELRPRRNFDVGLGGPGKGGKQRVNGGLVGIIIDARGRPLRLSDDADDRQQNVRRWLWDIGG